MTEGKTILYKPFKPVVPSDQDSEFTVIRWRKHELITMACVVLVFVALVAFTIGYAVAAHH